MTSYRSYALSIVAADETAHQLGGLLDYRFGDAQTRRVVTTLANGADSVLVEVSMASDLSTWAPYATHTGATTPFVDVISGPICGVRVTKTGANGAATIAAII